MAKSIKVTMDNYPDTIQIGDVTKVHYEDGILYKNCERTTIKNKDGFEIIKWEFGEKVYEGNIDLLIGGSPCQDFSFASILTPYKDYKDDDKIKFTDDIEENIKCKELSVPAKYTRIGLKFKDYGNTWWLSETKEE